MLELRKPLRLSALFLVLAGWTGAEAVAGQSVTELSSACAAAGGSTAACDVASSATAWLTSGAGLLSSAVTAGPDLHRTVGRRTADGPPRTGFDLRVAMAPLAHPSLPASGTGVVDRNQLALGVGAVIGLYEGLQPYPAFGGVFSLDALLGYSWLFLPESEGYEGRSDIQTFGVRIGLLRESFSAPGIAITVLRSLGDPVIYSGAAEQVVNVDPSTTTLRLAIGKDLLGVGVHAAIGQDRMSSNVRMGVPTDGGQILIFDGEYDTTRTVAQAGASLNFLVIRAQADVGWGFGGAGPAHPGLDADGGSLFGSLSVRLIL